MMGYDKCKYTSMSLVIVLAVTSAVFATSPAPGPLKVHPINPRYFDDGTGSGKAIYLTGSHIWNNFVDWGTTSPPAPLDHAAFLAWHEGYDHNLIRGWVWELPQAIWSGTPVWYFSPDVFERTGPGTANDGGLRHDLSRISNTYLDQIRNRAIAAGNQGTYISIMMFIGTRSGDSPSWPWYPFNIDNNINGIDGDVDNDGDGEEIHSLPHQTGISQACIDIQENYIAAVIDKLNDLDNIIWEIGNELPAGSVSWQYHMIDFIKSYEAANKSKQHLVWMNGWHFDNTYLFGSPAEVISPNRKDGTDYRNNPPATTGNKIIVLDTDHIWGIGGYGGWVWRSFTRGYHPIFMDPYWGNPWEGDIPSYEDIRKSMGFTRIYAEKMNLVAATPQNSLSTTGYCLADPGMEYFVYQPTAGASFTVNLPGGSYNYEWFNTSTGVITNTGSFTWAGGSRSFTPPFSTAAAGLYLTENAGPVAIINAIPVMGTSPLTVNFDGSASYDKSGGTIVSYDWDYFNDGAETGSGVTTSYLYRSSRTRYITAKLTVTDDEGYTDDETVLITVQPGQVGDFDGDSDVDQEDFGHFQLCISGLGIIQDDPDCLDSLLDGDEDVDQADCSIFLGCMSRANVPADPNCAD
ncbi:MAG: hypothetical protein JSV03_07210 [Planctomycetota bacterium]|nr:MAG: hypothetical protein JSV03_07210 [Planctomycetota bacterium]